MRERSQASIESCARQPGVYRRCPPLLRVLCVKKNVEDARGDRAASSSRCVMLHPHLTRLLPWRRCHHDGGRGRLDATRPPRIANCPAAANCLELGSMEDAGSGSTVWPAAALLPLAHGAVRRICGSRCWSSALAPEGVGIFAAGLARRVLLTDGGPPASVAGGAQHRAQPRPLRPTPRSASRNCSGATARRSPKGASTGRSAATYRITAFRWRTRCASSCWRRAAARRAVRPAAVLEGVNLLDRFHARVGHGAEFLPLAQFQEPHYPSDQEVRVEVYEVAVDADADPVAAQAFVDQLVAMGKTRTNPRLII